MADKEEDRSLEDFFSKKEKSKKTKGNKKQSKMKVKSTSQKAATTQSQTEEDNQEWEDFKDPREKDYSGLRIQALQIVETEKDKDEETASGDGAEDSDGQMRKEIASGVWQKMSGQPQQQAGVSQPSEPERPSLQKYVPGSFGKRKKPMNPPDLESESAFPSLSSTSVEKIPERNRSDFEVVKKGTRTKDGGGVESGPRLDLGNRYDSLRN